MDLLQENRTIWTNIKSSEKHYLIMQNTLKAYHEMEPSQKNLKLERIEGRSNNLTLS